MAAAEVLYDGHCELCSRSVAFMRRRARPGELLFVADHSPDQSSVVLVVDGHRHTRSEAVLGILARMRAPWPALGVLRVVPRRLRDAVYDWVAANRYRWFGRRACSTAGCR